MNVAWMKMAFFPSPYTFFCALQTPFLSNVHHQTISISNADKMRQQNFFNFGTEKTSHYLAKILNCYDAMIKIGTV